MLFLAALIGLMAHIAVMNTFLMYYIIGQFFEKCFDTKSQTKADEMRQHA
jgi:nucleoside permease NupC